VPHLLQEKGSESQTKIETNNEKVKINRQRRKTKIESVSGGMMSNANKNKNKKKKREVSTSSFFVAGFLASCHPAILTIPEFSSFSLLSISSSYIPCLTSLTVLHSFSFSFDAL